MTISVMDVMCTARLWLCGPEKFLTLFFEVFMNMKMKMIAAAAAALTGTGAFAACTATEMADAVKLLANCAPETTFYGAGATAMKGAIQTVLTTDGVVFDKSKPFVTITTAASSDMYAYYGFSKATGKRLAVIINGKNGSMAGVNQLLSKLKYGSIENNADQQEYKTIKLLTAVQQKANGSMVLDTDYTTSGTPTALAATVALKNIPARLDDFKGAWGIDKQKVAHMAFSDVRPNEASPGQVAKWAPASFPSTTIAMQGFGVLVNNDLYTALIKREVREGRLTAAACPTSTADEIAATILLAACQPSVSRADMTALLTGKATSADSFLRTTGETKILKLNRRPATSGTQAATQIQFAGQYNYVGKAPIAGVASFADLMAGSETTAAAANINADAKMTVQTHSGTSALIAAVTDDATGYSIGVASLENAAASKLGAGGLAAATPADQKARWVKVDNISPNFKADGSVDTKQRVGLQNGYSFAFEFQTIKSAALAGDYLAIYDKIVAGLKAPAANLTGIGYIKGADFPAFADTDQEASHKTTFVRNGNNYFPLSK